MIKAYKRFHLVEWSRDGHVTGGEFGPLEGGLFTIEANTISPPHLMRAILKKLKWHARNGEGKLY